MYGIKLIRNACDTRATCYRVLGIPRVPLDDWATVHVGPPAGQIGLWIQMWTHYRAVIRGEEIKKLLPFLGSNSSLTAKSIGGIESSLRIHLSI